MAWVWLVFVFFFGAAVGSFLNLLVSRLPLERSPVWPLGSRCLSCYQPLRWYDNLPLFSYLALRGRCRKCKSPFSSRYFFVELLTATGFVLLFFADVIINWFGVPLFRNQANLIWKFGVVPWQAWVFFFFHATLFSLLLVAAFCDLARSEIPLSLTMTGVALGLLASTLLPWPWPAEALRTAPGVTGTIPLGAQPWPFWGPLPYPPGSWQLGLANGIAGALVGLVMLRLVRYLFSAGLGQEALGLGDADLMMMAGAFMGWQIVVVSFFTGAMVGLVIAVPLVLIKGNVAFPFGPGLAIGVLVTLFAWPTLGPRLQFVLFDGWIIGTMAAVMLVGMFIGARVLRRPAVASEA